MFHSFAAMPIHSFLGVVMSKLGPGGRSGEDLILEQLERQDQHLLQQHFPIMKKEKLATRTGLEPVLPP